jgi:hypothetical protein
MIPLNLIVTFDHEGSETTPSSLALPISEYTTTFVSDSLYISPLQLERILFDRPKRMVARGEREQA